MKPVSLPGVDQLAPVEHPQYRDPRGALAPIDLLGQVPFAVVRIFWIHDAPAGTVRGGHAHKACHQYLICAAGSLRVDTYDGYAERSISLPTGHALHIPPGIFSNEFYEAAGSVLLVLCSRPYEVDDYLRDKASFLAYRDEMLKASSRDR